ncbi:cytochrome c oxidase subunit II [Shewanella khirikhana]|uniref:Cytochrome c oxidase subunit 2 n=1 Tax=Shewanella khirikhana TaxID=1965282 RepID=A0ABM7DS06_9GAMM|nr:cytochrome c oxidase subunit II [Shewanella khirikhana]AZQ12486.1 Cytochrome c oxidase subunit 2 precursor [Shewanella khirikhana]
MKHWLYCIAAALLAPPILAADMPLNMTQGVTEISGKVYGLHMTILYICCAIGVVVFGAMIYAMINHRKSKGAVAAQFHESTKVEIAWTLVPFLILVGMAIPATKTLIAMEDPSNAELTIKVTGSQWKWRYDYFDHDFGFYSILATPRAQIEGAEAKGEHYLLEVDNPLVLPTNRKVRFLMTSDDVIHSWWVPAFAVKKDANPGFINEAWTRVDKPGIYRGQCAELCGKDHGFMPIVVQVLAEDEFDAWVETQKQKASAQAAEAAAALNQTLSMEELMAQGEKVYLASCAACHQPNGAGLPGVFPALKGSAIATGAIANHLEIVINGKSGTAMQAFGKQLSATDIAAVVTYERNAWGNNTGDTVQAADVNGHSPDSAASAVPSSSEPAVNTVPAATKPSAGSETSPTAAVADEPASNEPLSMDELMARGEKVYMTACVACHQPNGAGLPGAFPALKGSPIATGPVADHLDIVIKGKAGTAMQAFGAQLSAQDIAAVVTYERNAWGNSTGDAVQATDVNNHGK